MEEDRHYLLQQNIFHKSRGSDWRDETELQDINPTMTTRSHEPDRTPLDTDVEGTREYSQPLHKYVSTADQQIAKRALTMS